MQDRSIELSIDAAHYVRAVQIHVIEQFRKRRMTTIGIVVLLIAAFALGRCLLTPPDYQGLERAILVMVAVFVTLRLLLIYVFVPWNARRTYRQQKSLHRPVRIEWSEDGFTTFRDDGRWTTPWSDFLRTAMHKDMILLYVAPNLFQLVPTRALSSEQLADLKRHAAVIDQVHPSA
jgi:hypothetical protein